MYKTCMHGCMGTSEDKEAKQKSELWPSEEPHTEK